MSIIGWIILGGIAGWLATTIMKQDEAWWANILIGIVGALVGGFIYGLATGHEFIQSFSIGTLLVAIGGAIVVLFLWNAITARA